MLGLLSIFLNGLCWVMFNFLSTANIIFVVTLLTISIRFYEKGKLYMLSNLVLCNLFAFFLVTWDNFFCDIIFHQFILLILCFCPFVSRNEFFL